MQLRTLALFRNRSSLSEGLRGAEEDGVDILYVCGCLFTGRRLRSQCGAVYEVGSGTERHLAPTLALEFLIGSLSFGRKGVGIREREP